MEGGAEEGGVMLSRILVLCSVAEGPLSPGTLSWGCARGTDSFSYCGSFICTQSKGQRGRKIIGNMSNSDCGLVICEAEMDEK